MDRQSFIDAKYLNNTGNCGIDECACEEANQSKEQELKKIDTLHLLAITMMALVFTSFIRS